MTQLPLSRDPETLVLLEELDLHTATHGKLWGALADWTL